MTVIIHFACKSVSGDSCCATRLEGTCCLEDAWELKEQGKSYIWSYICYIQFCMRDLLKGYIQSLSN